MLNYAGHASEFSQGNTFVDFTWFVLGWMNCKGMDMSKFIGQGLGVFTDSGMIDFEFELMLELSLDVGSVN